MTNIQKLKLDVFYFEEDGIKFSFVPSLNLCGYGKTKRESIKSLKIVLDVYLEYTVKNDTMKEDLRKFGWKVNVNLSPPTFKTLLKKNKSLINVLCHERLEKSIIELALPTILA